MALFDTVSAHIKDAMLARDKMRLQALRGIKKEFLEAKTAPGHDGELTDQEAVKILTRMAKQRRESAAIYRQQARPELAEVEEAECAVIEGYLPRQLSDEELDKALRQIIADLSAAGPKDMGRVMGAANRALAGQAEGRKIAAAVKALLN